MNWKMKVLLKMMKQTMILRKRGSILFSGGKENVSTHQANGTPESSSTSDENDHNTILRNSLLKDISRLKKKMVYKREEPYLTNLLVDYSSDEDDD